ncbi:hypothetical protein GCM10010372_34650 [Streptomyces tauricus]|nr:hypothetical protein GCM10010372_34650 [Streptomyces tauricus]
MHPGAGQLTTAHTAAAPPLPHRERAARKGPATARTRSRPRRRVESVTPRRGPASFRSSARMQSTTPRFGTDSDGVPDRTARTQSPVLNGFTPSAAPGHREAAGKASRGPANVTAPRAR